MRTYVKPKVDFFYFRKGHYGRHRTPWHYIHAWNRRKRNKF